MIDFSQLDRTIHEKGRLSLITHLRTLEKAEFIAGEKLTGDGRPQTQYALTDAGRTAFVAYLGVLEQILGLGK